MEVTIGGERLGAGKRNKVWMHNYERSTHDIGYVWRSTMAAGTLVPFMSEVGLPGDTMDIDLNLDVMTHPTIGPLLGHYKVQLDVFLVPVRLYQAELHMNKLGIGRDMSKILLPQILFEGSPADPAKPIDNQQTNPSSIFAYLGMRGAGLDAQNLVSIPQRWFNAIPYLGYWSIYKQYYANKQEEVGAMVHKYLTPLTIAFTDADIQNSNPVIDIPTGADPVVFVDTQMQNNSRLVILGTGFTENTKVENIRINMDDPINGFQFTRMADEVFNSWDINATTGTIVLYNPKEAYKVRPFGFGYISYVGTTDYEDVQPEVVTFDLSLIDDMRTAILRWDNDLGPFEINNLTSAPYGLPLEKRDTGSGVFDHSKLYTQEGLALKTYNSDLFNNWISTEWIDGADGISEITAVDTSAGSFTIDELNLSKKIYDMLNRIAISGGSYDDWLDAVYTHQRTRSAEEPMYLGGLIQKLVFQEITSQSATITQPLGTLAGKGRMAGPPKGGKVIVKIDEPSYVIGIASITPMVDYSQGNKWDTNLKTMNDFHKPALDAIGFQDLITDQMAWWDTRTTVGPNIVNTYRSAGKQPAWINYMTNVNKVYGNFADQTQQMFMVLNRRYDIQYDPVIGPTIKDLTTYIDPSKFNHIFANTRIDAQNFWMQIGVNIEARRKMSAKIMPNL